MSEAVLLLLCVAGCVTLVAAPLPSSELVDPKSPRARSARGSERRLAYTLLALASFVFLTLYAWSRGADWRAVGYLALLMTVSIVLIHPWLLVRGLLIPLGQVRMAHALSRLGGYPWLRDEAGGAALAGALALLRRGHDPALAEWLEEQIAAAPLGGTGLAAAGLIAASRDDVAGARALLESVEAIDVDLTPRTAWRVAIDWRVADAIGRGAYDEALTIGRTGLPPSRTTDFMLLAAARLAGEYVESEALIKRWLWAPRRLQTFGLLRRALAGVPAPDAIPTPTLPTFSLGAGRLAANDGGPPCSAALSLHVEVLADRDASPAAIRRLSRAWDRDLASPRLREALSRRVLDLRAPLAAEELLVDLREQCVEDLAALLRDRALELEALEQPDWEDTSDERDALAFGAVLDRAIDRVRGELLSGIEATLHTLAARRQQLTVEPAPGLESARSLDLWRTWLAVRDVYQDATQIGGLRLRRLAFPGLERELGRLALWMWQVHDERGFADAIFTWLLYEAEALGNTDSAETYRHNLAVSF